MLHRSKSRPSRRPSNLNLRNAAQRFETLDDGNRCSDGDSSQSSATAAPVFASVHRPRHAGISAIKRDGIPKTTAVNAQNSQQQRQTYQQYQQQRRMQQQQQQQQLQHQQQQQQLQQQQVDNASNSTQKYAKARNNRQEQQQQQIQQNLSTATSSKQSIAVSIPQLPMSATTATGGAGTSANAVGQINAQQQNIVSPTKTSRIPIQQQQQQLQQQQYTHQHQQNFNQISKTATNLLNDIYEKHLLSQTTFQDSEQYEQKQQLQQQQQHHYHYQQQQQQQQRFIARQHANNGMLLRHSGVGDFNFNNYAVNMRQQQHAQQQQVMAAPSSFAPIHASASNGVGTVGNQQQHHHTQQHKPLHFLKLPPPPSTPPTAATTTSGSSSGITIAEQQAYASYQQQHFQFSDAYVEPVNSNKHFILESQQQQQQHQFLPPPPPAPLNHVYETIKERPPLPPPPPERQQQRNNEAPPLPPSRQLKKRLLAVAASATATMAGATNARPPKNSSTGNKRGGVGVAISAGGPATAAIDLQKTQLEQINKKQNIKLQQPAPPAYVAPPASTTMTAAGGAAIGGGAAAAAATIVKQQQYNLQQRTKADGEQKSYIYQQLREHQQQQQQQQQQQYAHQQQQAAKIKPQQLELQQKSLQNHVREHPLGAVASTAAVVASIPSTAIDSKTTSHTHSTTNAACSASITSVVATAASSSTTTATTTIIPASVVLSVEHTLQHAGLLQSSAFSSSSAIACCNNINSNNNNNSSSSILHIQNNRPSQLPIVFEEDTGEFQDVLVLEEDGTAKLPYRHGKIEVRLETAQAMAAAAYYARAAQKLAQNGSTKTRQSSNTTNTEMPNTNNARNGGFCGALQRAPPPMPPGLARRLANKENYGIGKVKVMLRVSDTHNDIEHPHFMSVDKKKRQVTLTDPAAASSVAASTSQERGPMVAAPKMFAFDSLFTADDQQSDVCASALSEVIPAVLEGSDGCLLTIGYPCSGQSKTMLGGVNPPTELGGIPCAISWLYKGINERRQKSGARFSVRVSALGVSATKPDSSSKDLLAAHATESDDSPGVYLRDDFLGGPTELRAPTAERAALFLDAALAGRPQGGLEPAMIFTLHVYQYSLSRKGGVAGGRSRLHLIDLGGCANRNGGLPLSGIGNILLAILSGQRHPPNKDHPLTPLLKDCLAPLTCHVAIMAHVTHTQSHTDALTTIQLASRIHRMRRRKHRFPMPSDKTGVGASMAAAGINGGHQSTGSSAGSGADPSSSELSADTVIYMGPSDDATDGEHPPVYLPSLSSGDNRGVMSKVLKGSGVEKQSQPQPQQQQQASSTKIPGAVKKTSGTQKAAPQSPVTTSRTGSLKRGHANSPTLQQQQQQQLQQQQHPPTTNEQLPPPPQFYSPVHSLKTLPHSASSPKIVAGNLRHPSMAQMCSKGSNVPSPKGSPLRRPGVGGGGIAASASEQLECPGSPMRKITEEQWIDGPRVSRAKVAEARHLLREVNHVKQCETWIDGPKSQSSRSLTAGNLPASTTPQVQGYGFMDSHKKTMIRQWVENQTSQVFQTTSAASSPTHAHREQQAQHLRNITYHMSQLKQKSLDAAATPEDVVLYATSTRQQQNQSGPPLPPHQSSNDQHSLRSSQLELVHPIGAGLTNAISTTNASAPAEIRGAAHYNRQSSTQSQATSSQNNNNTQMKDETDLHSTYSLHTHAGYGIISTAVGVQQLLNTSASDTGTHHRSSERLQVAASADCDEDQDSGPSEVPPALPLIEPLGSREISHESLHRILSRHVSRESLYQQQQELQRHSEAISTHNTISRQSSSHHYSQHSMGMSDCGLQVTEEEIARTMGSEHPLAALSHCDNMSIVSSFNMAGDAFSDCAMGERTRNQFDQLARLREIFTSQLAMAEVTPVFRSGCDVGSVYSEPAFRFNTGPGSVCSEPAYRPPSPRQPSRSPSQGSLPSLNGIMQIAGMEQYASLRHPDGASDPNLPKHEKPFIIEHEDICEVDEKSALLSPSKRPSLEKDHLSSLPPMTTQTQLPLLPLNTSSEAYDSGHDSSTPRTSKHSGISRRAESGYHSVATARDSDESSFTSGLSKEHHNRITLHQINSNKKNSGSNKRQDKGLCTWLMNPFTCTYPETEGEISDF